MQVRTRLMVAVVLGLCTLSRGVQAQSCLYATKAYLAERNHRMTYSAPGSDSVLTKVGQWGWGPCRAVAVKGNYAFIGNGALLQILDISIPSAPRPVGQLLTDGPVNKVVISGDYAYTITPFRIIDITNPNYPRLVSTFKLPTFYPPTTFTVEGNYAYVGDFNGDIFIIDISNPYLPRVVGSMLAGGEMLASTMVSGKYLYAVTADGMSIDIFDISNPTSPLLASQYFLGSEGISLALDGNYLFLGTTAIPRLQVYDITDPYHLRYVGGLNLNTYPVAISIIGRLAYLSLDSAGFTVVDVSDPRSIRTIANIRDPYGFQNQAGVGLGPVAESITSTHAYLATGTGLWIVDIMSPLLASTSFFSTGWEPMKIATDSSCHAFVAELYGGLKIVDFSNPSAPQLVGQYNPAEAVRDVVVGNNTAYLLCDTSLVVLDISDPTNPMLLSNMAFGDTLNDNNGVFAYGCLILQDSTVYAARNSGRLYTIAVAGSNPPRVMSVQPTGGVPIALCQSANYLYLANAYTDIQVFEISDSDQLKVENSVNVRDLSGLCAGDSILYASDDGGFSEYGVADPVNPVRRYSVNIPGGITTVDMTAREKFAYMAYNQRFLTVDVSNPDSGKIIYSGTAVNFDVPDFISVAALNGIVLLGARDNGLLVLRNNLVTDGYCAQGTPPKKFTLEQNYPNPFNPSTMINYQLSTSSFVTLKVYDVLGREIKTLVHEYEKADTYSIRLNASNLASGVYFYQLTANGQSLTRKMVILR